LNNNQKNQMSQHGGKREGAGRKEGSVSKLTRSFKELVQQTYEQLELSGRGMKVWAQENETDFYKIASKLIPTEMGITAKIDTDKKIIEVEELFVEEEQTPEGLLIKIRVHSEDMGRVIGRGGKIIKAVRKLVQVKAAKDNLQVKVVLEE